MESRRGRLPTYSLQQTQQHAFEEIERGQLIVYLLVYSFFASLVSLHANKHCLNIYTCSAEKFF